jgi:hypothetical protein
MPGRSIALGFACAALLVCMACGGGAPRAATADLLSIRQPTPDPTLDAVVRDLPRALAGVAAPSPTATPRPPQNPGTSDKPDKPDKKVQPVPTRARP